MVRVTILMPNYNYGWCIGEAIESVLNQSFSDWELIVVDDCSTDNSVEVIKKYLKDNRIKLIVHNKNKGLAAAYLTGLKKAKGEFIAFLESDDIWLSNSLKKKVMVLEKSKCSLAYTDVKGFGRGGLLYFSKILYSPRVRRVVPFMKPFVPKQLLYQNVIITFSSVIIRKEDFEKLDFDVPSTSSESLDWWLWMQIYIRQSKVIFIPEKLTRWRIHGKSYNFKNTASSPRYLKKLIGFYKKMSEKVNVSSLNTKIKKDAIETLAQQEKRLNGLRNIIINIENFFKIIPPVFIEGSIYTAWISCLMVSMVFDPKTYRLK